MFSLSEEKFALRKSQLRERSGGQSLRIPIIFFFVSGGRDPAIG